MNIRLLLVTALAAAAPAIGQTTAPPRTPQKFSTVLLAASAAKADVALLRRALETIHPGLYRYQTKATIDRAFGRLEAVTDRPVDALGLHREIALLLATIHCDHTKAELPAAISSYRDVHPTHLPLRFRLIEGRMIVTANDGQSGAPPVGSEILRINDMTVPRVLLTLARAVSYDGDTDQAISVKLADDSDLTGDDFNEYYPSFFGFPERWAIVWKAIGASNAVAASLVPIDFKHWTQLDPLAAPYRGEFYKSITWRLAGKIARLRIDTFVNYRNPVQPSAFLAGFFRALKGAGTEHLILDLRNNSGGSEDVSVALARYLFDRPFLWSKPARYKAIRYGDLPPFIESWGDRDALFAAPIDGFVRTSDGWYERRPDANAVESDDDISTIVHRPALADRFSGKLTILTGPQNGSGATRTIAQLKENRGAVLVGEDTSGSAEGPTAGQIFLVTLPQSGIKVRIPNAWNRTNVAHYRPRLGVAADHLVVPTLADFETGRDGALETARAMPAPIAEPARSLADAIAGDWSGTLDYRDYTNDGRVVLPTKLHVSGMRLEWTFDDGPGKTVHSTQSWALIAGGKTLEIKDTRAAAVTRVAEFEIDQKNGMTLVVDGTVRENGHPAASRMIVSRRDDTLRITQMTRSAGEPFLMRHSYELRRVTAAQSHAFVPRHHGASPSVG